MELVKWVDHFEYVKIRMSIWIETFKIIIFEIKIIFCEDKKNLKWLFYCSWITVYCSWIDILNVLKWEWVFDKMTRNENCQNDQKKKGCK